jgi:hypothetical protein
MFGAPTTLTLFGRIPHAPLPDRLTSLPMHHLTNLAPQTNRYPRPDQLSNREALVSSQPSMHALPRAGCQAIYLTVPKPLQRPLRAVDQKFGCKPMTEIAQYRRDIVWNAWVHAFPCIQRACDPSDIDVRLRIKVPRSSYDDAYETAQTALAVLPENVCETEGECVFSGDAVCRMV